MFREIIRLFVKCKRIIGIVSEIMEATMGCRFLKLNHSYLKIRFFSSHSPYCLMLILYDRLDALQLKPLYFTKLYFCISLFITKVIRPRTCVRGNLTYHRRRTAFLNHSLKNESNRQRTPVLRALAGPAERRQPTLAQHINCSIIPEEKSALSSAGPGLCRIRCIVRHQHSASFRHTFVL